MKLVKSELTTPVDISATCCTFRFCIVMRGVVRFCVAWMRRPVTTSPWTVFDAVTLLATIPFAWIFVMFAKPFTESIGVETSPALTSGVTKVVVLTEFAKRFPPGISTPKT